MKSIAEALESKRIVNESLGRKRGRGCPFFELKCTESCTVIFPRWARKYAYYTARNCPCHELDKKYVVRRCDLFRKKHLTND